MKQKYDTIIIGGGVAGLGCAYHLTKNGRQNFMVISKDLIGDIPHSADNNVNYGAFYVQQDYHNILPFVDIKRRIHIWDITTFNGERARSLYDLQNILHAQPMVSFLLFLKKFHKYHEQFKLRCLQESQVQALKSDEFLFDLANTPAVEFVEQHNLEYWNEIIIKQFARVISFVELEKWSALSMSIGLLPLVIPTYEFRYRRDRLTASFSDKLISGEVTQIKNTDGWNVFTKHGDIYNAHHIVIATPPHIAKQLLPTNLSLNPSTHAHLWHINGKIRQLYQGKRYIFLPTSQPDLSISQQIDGSYLLYSLDSKCDPSQYFENYTIVAHHNWDPAFHFGQTLIESKQGTNAYVIGEHNLPFLEHAFITGIYAANQILQHS